MARVSNEQRLNFEQAVFDFLATNPSATTEIVGAALYDDWRSPGPEGSRPKADRATDWAKRKLKALAKNGKVYQPTRGTWLCNVTPKSKTTILRKKNKDDNGDAKGEDFAPISIFDATDDKEKVIDHMAFTNNHCAAAASNSPFIRGLLCTAERHGSVELSEPLLHALIEEMTMLLGEFNN